MQPCRLQAAWLAARAVVPVQEVCRWQAHGTDRAPQGWTIVSSRHLVPNNYFMHCRTQTWRCRLSSARQRSACCMLPWRLQRRRGRQATCWTFQFAFQCGCGQDALRQGQQMLLTSNFLPAPDTSLAHMLCAGVSAGSRGQAADTGATGRLPAGRRRSHGSALARGGHIPGVGAASGSRSSGAGAVRTTHRLQRRLQRRRR